LLGRFKLRVHRDEKELPVYALSKAGSSAKIIRSAEGPDQPPVLLFQDMGKLKVNNGSMQDFVSVMQSSVLDRPVVDRTGIAGRYDFTLNWTPDETQFHSWGATIPHPTGGVNAPPLATALQEQIGLKLVATRAPIATLVIDHVEKPLVSN
jgi:uncharacterized protein (TIGR03435 family)